jgi:predicted phage terminase large subunit-like protein
MGGRCAFRAFNQRQNKEARIISGAATVMDRVLMPANWHVRWPKFYEDLTRFDKVFRKNEHDDCADAITGIVDMENKGSGQYAIGTA